MHGSGQIKSAKLTGISVSGLLQVQASIRVSGEIDNDFEDPIGPSSGIPVEEIEVSGFGGKETITGPNDYVQCVAVISPADATEKGVVYSVKTGSTDKAVVSISGKVTPLAMVQLRLLLLQRMVLGLQVNLMSLSVV